MVATMFLNCMLTKSARERSKAIIVNRLTEGSQTKPGVGESVI